MGFVAPNNRRNLCVAAPVGAALVLCGLFAGCVYVPTAGHALEGDRGAASVAIAETFKPRETSRADVLLALGRPSQRRENDQFFIYEGRMTEGYLFIGAGYSGTALSHQRTRILVLEFTPENRFLRMTEVGDSSSADAWREVEAWMAKEGLRKDANSDAESEENNQ